MQGIGFNRPKLVNFPGAHLSIVAKARSLQKPSETVLDVAVALVTPRERALTQRKRLDDRVAAGFGVGGVVTHLGFTASDMSAFGADAKVDGAPALLASSAVWLGHRTVEVSAGAGLGGQAHNSNLPHMIDSLRPGAAGTKLGRGRAATRR